MVQAAYIACAPNGSCRKKYKTEKFLRDTHRLALLALACDTNKLVRPTWRTFGSAQECAQALRRQNDVPAETRIIIVRGEDRSSTRRRKKQVQYVTIARPVGAISATAIRQSVRRTGGIEEAVGNDWVPAAYLEYFQQHNDALHSLLSST